VRTAASPDDALLAFAQSTYEAAANLAHGIAPRWRGRRARLTRLVSWPPFMEDDPMPRFTRRDLLAAAPALGVAAVLAGSREARADQPHMDAALDALKSARRELDAATADKGGHRGNALRLVKQAITEVERGIEFAKRH
jgi:hypothetical protein